MSNESGIDYSDWVINGTQVTEEQAVACEDTFQTIAQYIKDNPPVIDGLTEDGGLEISLMHESFFKIRLSLSDLDIFIQDGGKVEPHIEKQERARLIAALERLIERVREEPAC